MFELQLILLKESESQEASTSKGIKRKKKEKDEFTEGQEYIRRQRALRQVEALKIGKCTRKMYEFIGCNWK